MAFTIVAAFPLGTYRGHAGEGEPDRFPSPARLHAALLAAAGQGMRASIDPATATLGLSDEDESALVWLEAHPPDGVHVPASQSASSSYVRYRDTGTVPFEGTKATGRWVDKVARDRPESSVAVCGEVAWTWSSSPPSEVRDALEAIILDVSHVGTAESPVRLRIGDVEPTHTLDPDADLWDPGGIDLDVPILGRTAALVAAHVQFVTAKVQPTPHSGSDAVIRPPREVSCVAVARYAPAERATPVAGPWSHALLLDLCDAERRDDRVRLAVAVHRALIALIGEGAPSVITGHFAAGAQRPANRLAIQLLDPSMPSRHVADAPATLALLVPADVDPVEMATIHTAIGQLTAFRGPGGRRRRISRTPPRVVDATSFWEPASGESRRWRTVVPAVADIRPPRGRSWSLEDAVLLAVALVWRERLGSPGQGLQWMMDLVDAARAAGVSVQQAGRLRRNDVTRFVHRVHPDAVVSAYHAVLELGSLGSGRDLVAIGQTRHLGGGLLVPDDCAA